MFFVIRVVSPPTCLSVLLFRNRWGGPERQRRKQVLFAPRFIFLHRCCLASVFLYFLFFSLFFKFFFSSLASSRFLNLYRFFSFHVFLFSFPPIGGIVEVWTLILSRVLVSGGSTSQKCRVKQKNTSQACFYVHRRTHFFLVHFIFFASHFFLGRYFLRARGSLFVYVFSLFTPVS